MCKDAMGSTEKEGSKRANGNGSLRKSCSKERRSKRDKQDSIEEAVRRDHARKKLQKNHTKKHKSNNKESDSGVVAILPSLVGLIIGIFAITAKMGFRGRPNTAGIDLGTTNSVICIQNPSISLGVIECIPDAITKSPIIPSIVAFRNKNDLRKHSMLVGQQAKDLLETHAESTFYHAKRVIGRPYLDPSVDQLKDEVQFNIIEGTTNSSPVFEAPSLEIQQSPSQIGSHVVKYLLDNAKTYNSAYSSISSVVIAIPAQFTPEQRIATVDAFKFAGLKVTRILEEPTAAALAYGLDKKDGVEHILVYDFGGGTLDVSVVRVTPDGFIDVIGSAGDSSLGGADFDSKVADFLLKKEELHISRNKKALENGYLECDKMNTSKICSEIVIRAMAERFKINLSNAYERNKEAIFEEECLILSSDFISSDEMTCDLFVSHTIALSSKEYDDAVRELYPRSILPIQGVLKELNMFKNDIDEIVMVGGTTRMPQIRELVLDFFKGSISHLNTEIDPDLTVAYGAASVND